MFFFINFACTTYLHVHNVAIHERKMLLGFIFAISTRKKYLIESKWIYHTRSCIFIIIIIKAKYFAITLLNVLLDVLAYLPFKYTKRKQRKRTKKKKINKWMFSSSTKHMKI